MFKRVLLRSTNAVAAALEAAWPLPGTRTSRSATRPPVGDVIGGGASLGIDPFFYFERLYERDSTPALIWTGRVAGIDGQSAPFIPAGPRLEGSVSSPSVVFQETEDPGKGDLGPDDRWSPRTR